MIFLGILLVLGLRTRQSSRYWFHAVGAVAIHLTVAFMFEGSGSSSATDDGLVAVASQEASDGPPLSGFLGLVSLALGWGVPIGLTLRGYERKVSGVSVGEPQPR